MESGVSAPPFKWHRVPPPRSGLAAAEVARRRSLALGLAAQAAEQAMGVAGKVGHLFVCQHPRVNVESRRLFSIPFLNHQAERPINNSHGQANKQLGEPLAKFATMFPEAWVAIAAIESAAQADANVLSIGCGHVRCR